MNCPVFRRPLVVTWWLPFLGAAVAVAVQLYLHMRRPPEYMATGKVIIGYEIVSRQGDEAYSVHLATQLELLQTRRVYDSALVRVRGSRPDVRQADVEIRVTRLKGSSIADVVAVGSAKEFTSVFLDAVLDEYLALKKEILDGRVWPAVGKIIDATKSAKDAVADAKKAWEAFLKANDGVELLAAERSRLSQLVSQLRGEVEALGASTDAAAQKAGLKDAEARLKEVNEKTVEGESLKESYERTLKELQPWQEKLNELSTSGIGTWSDSVAIMERPEGAVLVTPNLWLSLAKAAVLGFVTGMVLMLGIALNNALIVRTSPPPPP